MEAEAQHRFERARVLFQQAWDTHRSDYEAAIAAHFLARHPHRLEDGRFWNRRALDHALAAPPQEVEGFLPSLYLNLAHSHELLEEREEASRYLALGEAASATLPDSPYAAVVRDGLARIRKRLAEHPHD